MARLNGSTNRKSDFINTIYGKFHEINPPSARSFLPSYKILTNKKAIINPRNDDNKCFLYATGISVFYEIDMKNPSRVSKKLKNCCDRLNTDNINFPPSIKDNEQFEKDNPDISITIFQYGGFHKIKKMVTMMKILKKVQ